MGSFGINSKRKSRLNAVADSQYGYFTAKQAVEVGYVNNNHFYHIENGNWHKYYDGLFRLQDYPDSMESDFTKWGLWSRNQQDQPQGIITHNSALAFYGLNDYNPDQVHMTVPPRFRKKTPDEVIIHKASLNLSAIEHHGCFMVTRLGQTLADMRSELEAKGEWDTITGKVGADGKLSPDEMTSLDLSKNGNSVNPDIQTQSENAFDPVSEGVWKMIFNRTEAGRRRSRAGFTLVELLVVIAIISILAAMLMPALQKARDAAHQAYCSNNLKQLHIAISLYESDGAGYLPSYTQWGDPSAFSSNSWWWKKLWEAGYITRQDIYTKLSANSNRITCCPAAGRNNWSTPSGNITEIPNSSANETPTTYGASYNVLGSGAWSKYGGPCRMDYIPSPAKVVLLADSMLKNSTPWSPPEYFIFWNAGHWETEETNLPSFSPRHSGRANALCGGGNVMTFTPSVGAFTDKEWAKMFPCKLK